MDTLSLPLSFSRGNIKKTEEGTDEYFAQLLSSVLRTEVGELPLTPSFGCASPVFGDAEVTNLAVNAAKFIPEINIGSLRVVPSDSGLTQIQLSFAQV